MFLKFPFAIIDLYKGESENEKMNRNKPSIPQTVHNPTEDDSNLIIPVNRKALKYLMLLVAFTVFLYWGVTHTEKLTSIINSVFSVLSPFIIGLCVAYVLNMIMNPLERFWDKLMRKKKSDLAAKLKRPVCLILSLLLISGAIFIICFIIIPELTQTGKNLIDSMPQYVDNLENWWLGFIEFLERYGITLPTFSFDLEESIDFATSLIKDYGNNFIDKTVNITASIVSLIVNIVLGIVFSIYLLAKKEKVIKWTKKILYALLPKPKTDRLIELASLTNDIFTKFLTGQLTEAVIIGMLCFIGMLILRMPYAAVVSMMVGVTALIPVFGAFIGTAIGAFLILLVNPMKAFWFIIFIIVLQQLEGNLIYPKVVGKSIGLPGMLVFAAVTLGSGMFGVWGILFGVPIFSVLYTISREAIEKRLKERKIHLKE